MAKRLTKEEQQLRRTPKIKEGDETPAGYLGYDGPKESSGGDEAKTATLDNQGDANKPLDPAMAGPDAQAAGHPVTHDTQPSTQATPEQRTAAQQQRTAPPQPTTQEGD